MSPRMTVALVRRLWLLGLCLLLAGCSRMRAAESAPDRAPVQFFEPGGTRVEREYAAADGRRLGYVHHPPTGPPRGVAILYLHGIESHAGWFEGAARLLAARGYDVYSLDRRGSGINREGRGFPSGDVDGYETWLRDIHAFVERVVGRDRPLVLAGLSWGGKPALAYALAHPERVDALVLITPGLVARVDLAWHEKLGVGAALLARPGARFATPIETEMFTADPRWQALIRRDPLRLREVTARFLWESRRLDRWIEARVERNRIPILLFLAGRDRIVDNAGVVALLGRGRQSELVVRRYAGQTHSIQFEAPGRLVRDIDRWLGGAPNPPPWNIPKEED